MNFIFEHPHCVLLFYLNFDFDRVHSFNPEIKGLILIIGNINHWLILF